MVSGVTSGESIWGAEEDKSFFQPLYESKCATNRKFDIRLNAIGNKVFAYYHYLLYNNIIGAGGRGGSYLGITVRIDCYCKDFRTIYEVLDIVFRKKFVGSVLKPLDGGMFQYTCSTFKEVDTYLTELETYVRNIIGTSLTLSDFVNIPSMPSGKGVVRYNLDDATISNVMQAVGKYGLCSISPDYESAKLKRTREEEYNKGLSSRQNEIDKINHSIEALRSENEQLNQQLESAKDQLRTRPTAISPTNNGHVRQTWHHHADEEEKQEKDYLKYVGPILLGIMAVVIAITCYYCLYNDDEQIAESTEMVNTQAEEVYKLAKQEELVKDAVISNDSVKEVDGSNTFYITVSGIPDINTAELKSSHGDVNKVSEGKYEIRDCDKDSSITIVVTRLRTDGGKDNLKAVRITKIESEHEMHQ